MQMRLKSEEIWGHPFLLVLISNECYIAYIMHEIPLYASLHCDLEHNAKFWLQLLIFVQSIKELSLKAKICSQLQYRSEARVWGRPFMRIIVREHNTVRA